MNTEHRKTTTLDNTVHISSKNHKKMQRAGDATYESTTMAATLPGGIVRWFPRGYATESVDWKALQEHLSMVPDLAFEVTSGDSSSSANADRNAPGDQAQVGIPKGVCALHLTVACSNLAAPLELVQKLIEFNPDALQQTEENSGWNVLHCALKYNRHLSTDHRVIDLLIQANPSLVSELTTSAEQFGLPPLAFASCKEVVPCLAAAMSTEMVRSILRKIFNRRQLLGGSIEAMEQIVRELSRLELRQGRSIITAGIVPDKIARSKSVVEYTLYQTSMRHKTSPERRDLMRLSNWIIQATYCLEFDKDGNDEAAINSSPSPLQCLKTLIFHNKIKRKAMELYQSLLQIDGDNNQLESNLDYIEPDHDLAKSIDRDTGQAEATRQPSTDFQVKHDENAKPAAVNTFLKQLLQCKRQLDRKIDKSFETLKQTTTALEVYRDMYSSTIERLCEEAQAPFLLERDTFGQTENTITISSTVLPPNPPVRQASDDSIRNRSSIGPALEDSIQEAIEAMKVVGQALDRCNRNLSVESDHLIREQGDLKELDMDYFKTPEQKQAQDTIKDITEVQIEKESLVKYIADIKSQLNTPESQHSQQQETHHQLNLKWVKLSSELRDANRKVEDLREIITCRRQSVGAKMIIARRILNSKSRSKVSRTAARRFLKEAKQEMRELMTTLVATAKKPQRSSRRLRKMKMKQRQQLQAGQEEEVEMDEELTRMTKRMKL